MKSLVSHALPPKLSAFRSLEYNITAALDARIALLASLNGYPYAAQVIARCQNIIDRSSVQAAKQGVLRLRDIARFAAEILATVPGAKIERYLLNRSEMVDYIQLNKKDYGFDHLDAESTDLVANLITSSELIEATWKLDMAEEPEHNFLTQMNSLYQSLRKSRIHSIEFKKTAGSSLKGSELHVEYTEDQPLIYQADVNQLIPLQALPSIKHLVLSGIQLEDGEYTGLKTILEREETMLRLADIRFLDHLLTLFMSPEAWLVFIPPRPIIEPRSNEERMRGLRLFSAYLHSLLLIPQFFRLEVFRQGYLRMEHWLDNFPFIPADVEKNYSEIIKKYDTLQIAKDVEQLYVNSDESTNSPLGASIHTFFTEVTHLFGLDQILKEADQAAVTNVGIKITNLKELNENKYNYILLRNPIQKVDIGSDIGYRILDNEIFRDVMKRAYQSIVNNIGRYVPDDTVIRLAELSPTPPFPFHAALPITDMFHSANQPKIESGALSHRYFSINYDFETELTLREKYRYTIISAKDLTNRFPSMVAFDRDMAARFRGYLKKESWRTLYPSNLVMSDRAIEPEILKYQNPKDGQQTELKQIFEYISSQSFELIRRNFATPVMREDWATILSSFALMFYISETGTAKAGSSTKYTLVRGTGMPYGKTYEALEAMQDFTDDDMIPINDTVAIALLKRIPLPSHTLGVAKFDLGYPYYYCAGNGLVLDVKRFCYDEACLHFHMRPVASINDPVNVLFSKQHAFLNNTLLFQNDMSLHLNTSSDSSNSFNFSIKAEQWKGDVFDQFIEYRRFSKYMSISSDTAIVSPDDKETELNKMMEEMQKALEKADEHNPSKTQDQTQETIDLDIKATKSSETDISTRTKKKKDQKDESNDDVDIIDGPKNA